MHVNLHIHHGETCSHNTPNNKNTLTLPGISGICTSFPIGLHHFMKLKIYIIFVYLNQPLILININKKIIINNNNKIFPYLSLN